MESLSRCCDEQRRRTKDHCKDESTKVALSHSLRRLRSSIYSMAFTTPTTTDLVDACPPPKDLILTCREVRADARAMENHEYRKYCSETGLVVDVFNEGTGKEGGAQASSANNDDEQPQKRPVDPAKRPWSHRYECLE